MSRLLAASTSVSKLHFGYKKFRLDFHSGLRVASHVGDSVPATLTWTPAFHDKTIFMLESFWLRSQVLVTLTRVILGLYSWPRHRSFRQMYSHESVFATSCILCLGFVPSGKCTHMSQFSLELHFQVLFRDVMTPFIPELKRSFLFEILCLCTSFSLECVTYQPSEVSHMFSKTGCGTLCFSGGPYRRIPRSDLLPLSYFWPQRPHAFLLWEAVSFGFIGSQGFYQRAVHIQEVFEFAHRCPLFQFHSNKALQLGPQE